MSDVEDLAAIVDDVLGDDGATTLEIAEAILAKNYVIPKRWAADGA